MSKEIIQPPNNKIEKSFFYRHCIVVNKKFTGINNFLISTLRSNDFAVEIVEKDDKNLLLISQTNEKKFLIEAQLRKIRRATKLSIPEDSKLPKKLLLEENKRPYTTLNKDLFKANEDYIDFYELINKKENERFGLDLFTEAEMLYLEKSILTEIEINPQDLHSIINNELTQNKQFKEEFKIEDEAIKNLFNSEHRLYYLFEELNLFEEIFPIHTSSYKDIIGTEKFVNIRENAKTGFNVNNFRNYLGDYMAIYFYWLDHYTSKFILFFIFNIHIRVAYSSRFIRYYISNSKTLFL